MRVILIDDEKFAIDEIKYFLKDYQVEIINSYQKQNEALDNLEKDKPEVAFLDINMPGGNGIELAYKIQNIIPDIKIVFVTGYSSYALEAYKVHPADYLVKPIDKNAFRNTMDYLFKLTMKTETNSIESEGDSIKINVFGKFIMTNTKGEQAKFPTKKAKELFAYLLCNIDKPIYRDEIIQQLFDNSEPEKAQNNFYVTLYRLRSTLESFQVKRDQLVITENSVYIKNGICGFVDFTRFVSKNQPIDETNLIEAEKYINEYNGEFLSDVDSPWIYESREWYDLKMKNLILDTAEYYKNRMDYKKSDYIIQKALNVDPLFVEGFEFSLELYISSGDDESYTRKFKKYERLMVEEMEIDPDPRYIKHFKDVL